MPAAEIRYTNTKKIPLALAVYLATDHYDFDPNTLSATALIRPVRQTILKARVPKEKQLIDIDSLIQSRLGTSIHDGIEKAWTTNYEKALAELGYPEDIINRIVINPNPELVWPNQIPVYMEQRHYQDITVKGKKFTISGKMDFIAEGVVQDFKTTIAYTYKLGTKLEDFALQGSIYRWLAPHIITGDYIHIHYIFMDWAAYKVNVEENYPESRCVSVKVPLLSLKETESFIKTRLTQILDQQSMPEPEIQFCTDKELWREDDMFKYYKKAENANIPGKRSSGNFTVKKFGSVEAARAAAQARFEKDGGTGVVKTIKGQVKACNYCPGFFACTQKDQYIKEGLLTITKELP